VNSLVLFDTHVIVWSVTGDTRLGKETRGLLQRAISKGVATISAANVYELVWIAGYRNVTLGAPPDVILDRLAKSGLRVLEIDSAAARLAATLKLPHGDPIDRMLSAAALQSPAGNSRCHAAEFADRPDNT
jgi:PIN domain nuclease of toxin-antitoxin system